MSFVVRLTEEAKEDIFLAVEWYNEIRAGLGDSLTEQLEVILTAIQRNPASFKKVYRQVQQAAVKKFPYVVLFKIEKDIVVVYCVFHTRRDPKKKIKRLQ